MLLDHDQLPTRFSLTVLRFLLTDLREQYRRIFDRFSYSFDSPAIGLSEC